MGFNVKAGLEPSWYTPKDQEKSDKPAKFKLKPLTQMELLEAMEDAFGDDDGNQRVTAKGVMRVMRSSLMDWEEVTRDGEKLLINDENIRQLPSLWLRELANKLILDAILDGQQSKN